MKTIATLIIILLPIFATAQSKDFEFTSKYLLVHAGTKTIKECFQLTDMMLSNTQRGLNRFVEKDGNLYYRAGMNLIKTPPIYALNSKEAFDKIIYGGSLNILILKRKGIIKRYNI
jgi:hypothetical protein